MKTRDTGRDIKFNVICGSNKDNKIETESTHVENKVQMNNEPVKTKTQTSRLNTKY